APAAIELAVLASVGIRRIATPEIRRVKGGIEGGELGGKRSGRVQCSTIDRSFVVLLPIPNITVANRGAVTGPDKAHPRVHCDVAVGRGQMTEIPHHSRGRFNEVEACHLRAFVVNLAHESGMSVGGSLLSGGARADEPTEGRVHGVGGGIPHPVAPQSNWL